MDIILDANAYLQVLHNHGRKFLETNQFVELVTYLRRTGSRLVIPLVTFYEVVERYRNRLMEVAEECVSRSECLQIDRQANKLNVTAIFSWHEKEFVATYAELTPAPFANRSPIERAVLGLIEPKLLTTEHELIAKNDFQMVYKPFDWSLNDLTGRGR